MILFLRKLMCYHFYVVDSIISYDVIDRDESIEGEVTFMFSSCKDCKKEKIIIIDRIHFKKK